MMSKRIFLKTAAVLAFSAMALPSFAADDPSVPPEGSISIVYYRADGNYNGWGVHGWIAPGGGNGTPIDGVDWFAPWKPAGKLDDGSIYFHIPLAHFGKSGTVNYIIHKGDSKEQGGKNQKFDGNTIKQVWVNSGDPVMYTVKEEAVKARTAAK